MFCVVEDHTIFESLVFFSKKTKINKNTSKLYFVVPAKKILRVFFFSASCANEMEETEIKKYVVLENCI